MKRLLSNFLRMTKEILTILFLCMFLFVFSGPVYGFQKNIQSEDRFHKIIANAAERYDVDIELVKAMIMAESGYDMYAVSDSGAVGLMQLMPATAEALGVENYFDPIQNVNAGVRYLKILSKQFDENLILALAAYNAGPTRVRRCRGIPKIGSTMRYVLRVMGLYLSYKLGIFVSEQIHYKTKQRNEVNQ